MLPKKLHDQSICFLITGLHFGGAETVVINLASNLKRRGWTVKLVSMMPPGERAEKLIANGIEVASLKMRRGVPDPRAVPRLVALIRKWRPSVLHSHMIHANFLGRFTRLFLSLPVLISTAHNINEGGRWRMLGYKISDFLADMTTNVSQAAVNRYIDIGIAPSNKICLVPNGLDTSVFRPNAQTRQLLRNELGVGDQFMWLAVGRMENQKDYPVMFQSLSRLKRDSKARLFIAGKGPLEEDLKQLANKLNIEDKVTFLGLRKDIPKLMNAADAYVMSSAWEGMPMVLLEAAATGLPIVATDVGGNREVVIDGLNGLIVPPKNPEVLANAMKSIMAIPDSERMQMGKNGRAHVDENYSIERVVDMWENLYGRLLTLKN
ncbi:MAG: glycosyl transferase family 1 [Gammaproteobacteria bacterium SG8_11]|nr:MAG: glycosyl transferase family 1 [Gammaproteobacteria bacterium SG8_11]